MTGTNHAIDGLRRITRLAPTFNLRLVVFAAAVAFGVLSLLWIQASVGRQMAQVQQEFGAIRAEGFYVGVQMRVNFRKLNDALLGLHLQPTAADRTNFLAEARSLKEWLVNREGRLTTRAERTQFNQMEAAYDRYLAAAQPLLAAHDPLLARASFADAYEQLQGLSQPVLEAVAQLVQAQQVAFDIFLRDSQRTLAGLERLLNLSLVLLLGAVVALAWLVYRGMIAPLRRRLTESQVIIERQEKLASLGTLAAGVAHEIRNPLTAIKFRLFSLTKSLPPEFAQNEDAGVIGAEINRLDRIVKDFLQFARPSDPQAVRVPVERVLQEVHDLLAPQLEKSAIQLRLDVHGATWVHADTQQIKQVFINLIQNAADAIGRNGSVSLRVKRDVAEFAARSRPAAIVQVTDTGKGIRSEVQKRLFDPFFSTKAGGTGLGLAIAARIVEKHGGLLRYHTESNQGTTFEVVLPRLEDHATQTSDH